MVKEKEKQSNLDLCKKYWKVADSEWGDWRRRARKAYKFYLGDQWDGETKTQLDLEKRPYLTLNKIKPIIRNLSGWQRQNRQDLKVLPRRGGVAIMAEAYTDIIKYFYDTSMADWHNSFAFFDGAIGGKGWISIDIDYTKDPFNGDLMMARENPLMIREDPFSTRYDLSDAKFCFRSFWMDKEQVESSFPDADLDQLGESTDDSESTPEDGESVDEDAYDEQAGFNDDAKETRFLIKECYHRKWKKKTFLVDTTTLEVTDATGIPKDKIEKIASMKNLKKVERVAPTLYLTTYAGEVELQDVEDPFDGITDFPLIRFCAEWLYWDKPHVKGEVDDLIDPQIEHNKRRSQALHLLNTSANSGWILDDDAVDPDMLEKLERMGSSAGITVIKKKGSTVERITPSPLSDGHIALEKLAEEDLKKISGVNADLLGLQANKNDSGVAIDLRRKQGLITTEPIFDNFEYTQRILGNTIMSFIRHTDVLSTEELLAILDGEKFEDKAVEILQGLKRRKVGKYGMVVTTRPSSDTQRMFTFQTMLDALAQGLPIPKELVAEASDWPFKEELVDKWKAEAQALEASAGAGIPSDTDVGATIQ